MPRKIDLAAALAAEAGPVVQQMTLNDLVEAYFARNPTADGEYRVRKWLDAFGDHDAWNVSSESLERAAEAMLKAGYAPGSVNRDVGVLGSAYRWAKRRRFCPRGFVSPTLAIRRYPEPVRRVHITDEEIERLRVGALASRSPGFGAFVSALIDSGARKSEVLERRWRDLDPEAGTLIAEQTKTDNPRVLFLQPRTVQLIERLKSSRATPECLIFRGRFPDKPNSYRTAWRNLTTEIGRPDLHLHDLRHARAASMLRTGVTSAVAAQVLGHAPEVLHRRYGHLQTRDLREAIERSWT